jgi:hypothetical protein
MGKITIMNEITISRKTQKELVSIMVFLNSATKKLHFQHKFIWAIDGQLYSTDGCRIYWTHTELPKLEDGPYNFRISKESVTLKLNPICIKIPVFIRQIEATDKYSILESLEIFRGENKNNLRILSRLLYPVYKKEIYLNGEYVKPLADFDCCWSIRIAPEEAWKNAVRYDNDRVSAIIMSEIL